ncbi:hypothetical protein O181_094884 [Austropuccinia psidii MF-1]|uniref:Peptidase A2 domain-containing protein n=1 Tax=Austropuccinia psidii MF-1 TaxID=1389203 RepID=A0A9Q3PB80_9BASI|nr:hypothetical protein [Austropuccinia psidii MF-1]
MSHHLANYEQPKLHYACPLGFLQVYVGEEGHEIMALVDTGSELNIIPAYLAIKAGLTTRCLNMNSRGIGGHCTLIVGLAEFTPITLVTGEERNVHLFVARGEEIFRYIEPDGRRLCLPIRSPQKVGWREEPPAGMEACASATVEVYNDLNTEDKESFGNIGSDIKFFKKKESPQEIQTLANTYVENKTSPKHLTGILDSEKQNTRKNESLIRTIHQDSIITEEQGVIKTEFNRISQGKLILKGIPEITHKDPDYNLGTKKKSLKTILSPKKLVKSISKLIRKEKEILTHKPKQNSTPEEIDPRAQPPIIISGITKEEKIKNMKYLPSLDLEYLNKNSVQNRERTKVNENTFDPPVAGIEENLGYTELTKLSKEEGLEQKTENPSFNQQEEKSINLKESPMSTTKEHKVTETKIQNNNSDIFCQGQNKKEMGIHEEFTYPINIEDYSINTKEEDSLIPHNHSNKGNTKLNLEINHFLLNKSKESQMNKNEEISEEISNRQVKQDQEALSKQKNMAELAEDGILLTEDQFPWEGYTNWQPLRNANLVRHNYNSSRDNFECANQHVKWLEDISKPNNNKLERIKDENSKKKEKTKEKKEYFWITQKKKICPSLQAHLARQYQI